MAGKRLQKPARRKKKRGVALLVSYLVRAGMLAALLACAWLVALGVNACADYFKDTGAVFAVQDRQEDESVADAPGASEELSVFAGLAVGGVVTVDPGHGGIDPGCGEEGALEKDIVLPISMHVKNMLEEAGVSVVMTRQMDETVSLDDRAIMANNAGSDLFVSIHCNSYEGEARGMDCYYYKAQPAQELAQSILDEAAALGITTRQVQKNNYQVLWDTDMTAVLVETGFLTDPNECFLLCDADYQKTVAQAIAGAVLKTLQAQPA